MLRADPDRGKGAMEVLCVYVFSYVCIHTYVHVCMYTCMYTFIYTCIYIYIYMLRADPSSWKGRHGGFMCACIFRAGVYIHTNTHTSIHTYIHTYTYISSAGATSSHHSRPV